jgi:hypothetical protein
MFAFFNKNLFLFLTGIMIKQLIEVKKSGNFKAHKERVLLEI